MTTAATLEGKSVVVTGAARGLGAAIAACCAASGARVVLTDVLEDELRATAAQIGPDAIALPLDVADPAAWERLASVLERTVGCPDALVNNAGVVRANLLVDTDFADLERTLAVNVGGTFLGMQTYVRMHAATGGSRPGSIVNISSTRGLIGGARTTTYSASKFAVRGLTKAAAVELGPLGIRVNAVCPGPTATDMTIGNPQFDAMDWDAYVGQLPLGRMGLPEDVGAAVVWLASDASAFVTGVDLPVDGGLTATSFGVAPRAVPAG